MDRVRSRASERGHAAPFRDTPTEVDPRSSSPSLRVRGCRSGRVPRESLDAPNDLTEEAPCQVAFSQLKDEVPRMPDQAGGARSTGSKPRASRYRSPLISIVSLPT